tara:strand:- start:8543 stop:8746 length:204 start_codon:yes stop_codon:yes gene_type:complete
MEIFELIERYGVTLVLLVGCFYALYQFFFFSVREVKSTFEKHHERNADNMNEIKDKINKMLELIKNK